MNTKRKFSTLIVDEELMIRDLLLDILSVHRKDSIKIAFDGEDAFSKVRLENYDLIVN